MIQGYKSSIERLANSFKQSRDRWKHRAGQLQRKLRAKDIRIRDLEKSRELWKRRAKTAEKIVREYHTTEKKQAMQLSDLSDDKDTVDTVPRRTTPELGSGDDGPSHWSPARGHHYSVFIIQLAVAFVVYCLNSFRGAARNFALLGEYFALASPCYSSIRQWVLRVGLYELQRERENRSDWLFIIDMTLELGARKCLVVLGISQARWQHLVTEATGELSHQEMEVLGLEVMSQSKGEAIYQVLEQVTSRVGVPLQIISDHGSDLNKGIRLYQQAHPQVRVTYDITHQCARLLKGELELDKTYSTFAQQCARTRQQLQQTPLSFLMPPTQRAKARYFNVDSLLKWATKVLAYQQGDDFSEINPCFCLEQKTLDILAPHLDATTSRKLQSLKNQIYPDKEAFRSALQASLSPQMFSILAPGVIQGADLGRRYCFQKLGWLQEYRTLLEPYTQMLALVRTLQHDVKHQGLTTKTKTNFIEQTSSWQLSPRLVAFKRKLLDYLELQTAALRPEQSLLGSSDIIESVFGKYKLISAKSPLKHMGHLILTLPLLTAKLTAELICTALETVSFATVSDWYFQVFGLSPLAKRRAVFRRTTVDTECA